MGNSNLGADEVRKWIIGSVLAVVTAYPGVAAVNETIAHWHVSVIEQVTKPEIEAALKPVREKAERAVMLADGNSGRLAMITTRLDAMTIQGAVVMVSTLERELATHRGDDRKSDAEWKAQDALLRNRLRVAKDYKDCLMNEKRNCDELLRGSLWN